MLDCLSTRTALLVQFNSMGAAPRLGKGSYGEVIDSLADLTHELTNAPPPDTRGLLEMQQTSILLKQMLLNNLNTRLAPACLLRLQAHQVALQTAFGARAAGLIDAFVYKHSGVMPAPIFMEGSHEAEQASDAISLHRGLAAAPPQSAAEADSRAHAIIEGLSEHTQQMLDFDVRNDVCTDVPGASYVSGVQAFLAA